MSYPKVRFNHLKVRFMCRDHFRANPETYRGDSIAQREYWLNLTDELSRAGLISQDNRDHWSCPF